MKSVEAVLLENIDNRSSRFIFPTSVSVSGWVDHLLRLRGGTLEMKQFLAWDDFKRSSIKSKVDKKKSIPSALRKIFVSRLVKENAENCAHGKTPVFTSLIRAEWADNAAQFSPWLARILPQLGIWFSKTTGLSIDNILNDNAQKAASAFEGDDRDMFNLAQRYAHFLNKYNLFEPAWETPPFNDDGKEYFLFFPESISDFAEYSPLLEASSHVKIIPADNTEGFPCDAFFYTNSRREITESALYIRALHEKNNIPWDSIAVCIPDSQNYEPYVMREFANRNIPFVKKISKPLTDYPAGSFFGAVLDCTSSNYSFSAVTALVMNRHLPWKEEEKINKLINFGMKNNCLYSWEEEIDGKKQHINVWEDAFSKPLGFPDYDTEKFFKDLKWRLQAFRSADSFAELRKQYFTFREKFFDMEQCLEETDFVLSRCISGLMELVEIEKNYPEERTADPLAFFTEFISEVPYLAQQKAGGVVIYPYKTAAAVPFDCHIVLGAGQKSLSVINNRLDFIPRKKREKLGIFDEDASASFINLHKYNSVKFSAFFCSEKTFSEYSIPHPKINFPSKPNDNYANLAEYKEKFSDDHYSEETTFCSALADTDSPAPQKLHENQIKGFTEWTKRRQKADDSAEKWNMHDNVRELIRNNYKYRVSASSLKTYCQCSLKWLFEKALKLENIQIETNLMPEYIAGNIYHAVLNNFFSEIKNKNESLLEPVITNNKCNLPSAYNKLLKHCIDKVFNNFPLLANSEHPQMSTLTTRLLHSEKKDYEYKLGIFLSNFISYFAGYRIASTEESLSLNRDSYSLYGIVDCILEETSIESDKKYVIVDFKLNNLPNRSSCTGEGDDGLTDFQLPMYITLVEENNKLAVSTALFYSIIKIKPEVIFGTIHDINNKNVFPKKKETIIIRKDECYEQIFNEFNKKTEQFSHELFSGNFTVFETKNNKCFECAYHKICRTVYIINRGKNLNSEKNK